VKYGEGINDSRTDRISFNDISSKIKILEKKFDKIYKDYIDDQ
jgi:hypothetical protein